LESSAAEQAEDRHWQRLYGPFDALDLEGTRTFFEGFDRPWWLVGGWAAEAFTGAPREHEDIDVSLLACDVPALREFVGDRWHLWTIVDGRLGPMTDQFPDLPTPDADGQWQSKRDPDHVVPLDEVTWLTDDGVRVLNPEIVLLFKARLDRTKDRRDLARALPLLTASQRTWLRDGVRRESSEHPWLARLDAGSAD
jgi:hypothetical protein